MQNERITVRTKHVYGNKLIYPVCARAEAFARIAGTKTLSLEVIRQIKMIGFGLVIQAEEIATV